MYCLRIPARDIQKDKTGSITHLLRRLPTGRRVLPLPLLPARACQAVQVPCRGEAECCCQQCQTQHHPRRHGGGGGAVGWIKSLWWWGGGVGGRGVCALLDVDIDGRLLASGHRGKILMMTRRDTRPSPEATSQRARRPALNSGRGAAAAGGERQGGRPNA